MFGDFRIADLIAYKCSVIDNICRSELRDGTITSERDYVSALSTRIRDEFRPHFPCHAQTIRQAVEMEYGVDGIIIFKSRSEIKIGWYEAKWPRVGQRDYHWDRVHAVRGISHFTEQILKQHQLEGSSLALWEMFFNEETEGYECPPYDSFGSSCVWHNNAYDFMTYEGLMFERWSSEKLKEMLESNGIGFYSVINDIISCRKGKKIKISEGQTSVMINDPKKPDNNIIEIPLPGNITKDYDDRIQAFMKERNIAGYLFIDIREPKN